MKLYCNIEKVTLEDGTSKWVIKEGPCELPQNASNVSNLNLLDDETLKHYGWVPVKHQAGEKSITGSVEYEITEDQVTETVFLKDKTEEELAEEAANELKTRWEKIREHRNFLLEDSDKLVLSDRWEKLTEEEKVKISNYRQALRDLPNQSNSPYSINFPSL